MKDAWPFLGALLVIIILAIVAGEKRKEEALTGGSSTSTPSFFGSTQPPSNTPDSQGETISTTPTPERTEPPLTPEQVEYKVATLYRELDALREDLRVARLHEPASPYANTVTLRQGDVYTEDPDREYLILEANRNNTAGIPLSRWYLTSYVTDESAHLPRGDRILEKWRSPVSDDIVLLPGETAYLITGDSPIDVSFRENICTGYLANEGDFFPGLYRQCPRPSDELSRFGNIELDNDTCYDFIERLGTCVTPEDEEYTQAKVGGVCSIFIENTINYNDCVNLHRFDPYFARDGFWRIYLGENNTLWRSKREIIRLHDENDRIVSVIEY